MEISNKINNLAGTKSHLKTGKYDFKYTENKKFADHTICNNNDVGKVARCDARNYAIRRFKTHTIE